MIETHDHISSAFNNELSDLNDSLLEMGAELEKMFNKALQALSDKDESLAKSVVNDDKNIDGLETSVINQIQMLIAKRQPVGVDLRILVGCTRIAGYLERTGDLLSSVCRRGIILTEHSIQDEIKDLLFLGEKTLNLFKESLDAFINKDFRKATDVRINDLEIDKIHLKTFTTLLDKMTTSSKLVVPGTHMLFISKNFERIGDHATNIAESIAYMASGDIKIPPRKKLN